LGKAPKEPPVNVQNEFSSLNRANDLLTTIMSGHADQTTYTQFLGSLKAGGKTGMAIISSIPGQGSMMQKFGAATDSNKESEPKWRAVQKSLSDTIGTYQKAINTTYPDWGKQAGATTAAGAPKADEGAITVSPEDLEDETEEDEDK
jgi:hypothetical protein